MVGRHRHREIGTRDVGADECADDRTGRGADDNLGVARVQAGRVGDTGQHPGVEGVPDGAARAQDHTDSRTRFAQLVLSVA